MRSLPTLTLCYALWQSHKALIYIVAFVDPIRELFGSMLSDAGSTQDVEPLIMRTSTLQAKGIEQNNDEDLCMDVSIYIYIYIDVVFQCM